MKKKLLLTVMALVCALTCAFGFVACGESGGKVAVESVTLNKTTLTLEIDGTETLTATVTPDNATDKTVSWQSSAPAVASVDNAGKVTAKTAGSATITATAGAKKAECSVTVNAAQTKMTEQEWQASLTAFAEAKNFHLTMTVATLPAGEVKMQGDTYYDKGGQIERIFVKDGSKYYRYDKLTENAEWTKAETTKTVYDEFVINDCYHLVTGGSQAFASSYASFEYADGKYTADTISVTTGFTLKDIEITVTNNAITKIVCTQAGGDEKPDTLVTIDGIGTTEIPLPKIKEPTSCVLYRIPKNKDYAEVSGYSPKTEDDLDVLIADTYQGKPVKVIKANVFGSKSAKSVIIPDSVTTIENFAFKDSKSLAEITIPDSVTSIGSGAFKNTAWLNNQPDGLVYAGKVAYVYKGDIMQLKSITIADGTNSIAESAFSGCEYLTDVVIPDSVKSIGKWAFQDCLRLTNVSLGNGVESIGTRAFANCAFESITIPVSVTSMGDWVFDGMEATFRTLIYNGTQEQWDAIKKDTNWNVSVSSDNETMNFNIKCTGDAAK